MYTINSFQSDSKSNCHPFLYDACILRLLLYISLHPAHLERGNMYADYVANEGIILDTKMVWEVNFPNRLVDLAIRNIFNVRYERL